MRMIVKLTFSLPFDIVRVKTLATDAFEKNVRNRHRVSCLFQLLIENRVCCDRLVDLRQYLMRVTQLRGCG